MLTQILLTGLVVGNLYAPAGVGLVVMYKTSEIINFAQGDTATLTTFVAFTLLVAMALAYPAVFVLVLVAAAGAGIFIYGLAVRPLVGRRSSADAVVTTLGIAMVINGLAAWIGHASFVAVGAYTSAFLTAKLGASFPVAFIAAGAAAGVAGFLLGVPCLQLSGPYLAVATLAFGWVVPEILLKWSSVTGGHSGLYIPPAHAFGFTLDSSHKLYYLVLGLLVVLIWVLANVLRSRIGRVFVTLRESEVAAQAMGIRVAGYKILAFTMSSPIAGLGGSLYSHVVGAVTPFEFRFWVSVFYLVAVVIGGVGSLGGSLAGAVFITLVPELTAGMRNLPLIIYGTLLVVVTLAFPSITQDPSFWDDHKAFPHVYE